MISVIIPTYNRAEQLSFCLDSILNAEYDKLQIIIIDDGSTDNSRELCRDYMLRDSRIEYYYQENGGVSKARNLGLSKAQGDWITFCDSDDAIRPNHFDIVANNLSKTDCLLMTGSCIAQIKDNEIVYQPSLVQEEIIERESAIGYLFSDEFNPYRNGFFFIWNKFFHRKIIESNNLRFNEKMSLDEDMNFTLRYLNVINGIIYSKSPSYFTIEWSGITHLGRKKRSIEEYLYVHKQNKIEFEKIYHSTGLQYVKEFGDFYAIHRTVRLILLDNESKITNSLLESYISPFFSSINPGPKIRIDLISKILFHSICKRMNNTARFIIWSFLRFKEIKHAS